MQRTPYRNQIIKLKVTEEEKAKFQELANACCSGNLSDMIRKAVRGGHAAQKITSGHLISIIKQAFREVNSENAKTPA